MSKHPQGSSKRSLRSLAICLLLALLLCLAFSSVGLADDPTCSVTKAPVPDPIWTVTPSVTTAKAGDTVQVTVSDTAWTSWATGLTVTGQSGTAYPFTTITAATGNAQNVNGAGVYSFTMPSEPVSVGFTWDATPLNIYVKIGSAAKTLVHSYTRAEMEALAAPSTTSLYYSMWNRTPEPFVGKAVRYVTIAQLVASAHSYDNAVRFDGPDCVLTGLSMDNWTTNLSWSYLLGTSRKYYAALGDPYLDSANRTGQNREAPPVLAITGWSASGEATAGAPGGGVDDKAYDTLNAYRLWYGLSAAEYGTGSTPTTAERDARCTANNQAKYVTELTFEIARTNAVTQDSSIIGGTLSFSPPSGIAGTTVTVTPNPDSGWQLVTGSLKYTADSGATYTSITSSNGIYSFTLPAVDTTVTARFGNMSVPVTGVSLNKTTDMITVGKSDQLVATVTPSDAGNQDVTWSSSAPSVATVTSTGLVTGKAVGASTITVSTADGGHTANCLVTVKAGGLDHFTIAVLPDAQFYTQSYPSIFKSQTQWIADHKTSENIVFVAETGDIINDYGSATEWQNAQEAMATIRTADIPYAVVPGNHDLNLKAGDPTQFNTYFPASSFTGCSWYGEGHPEGSNTSSYQLFEAMGQKFVVLDLVCSPKLLDAGTIDWANTVLDTYANRKAIVITHGYVQPTGDLAGGDEVSGPSIRNNIVVYHPNVIAVLCGHIDGEYHGTDTGNNGNTIYNLLTDYTSEPNGGNGWLRLYEFYPLENKISAVTYSPTLNDYQTDSDSQFDLTLAQDSHLVTFMSEGQPYTARVTATGTTVSAPPPPTRPGYEFAGWYANEALTTPVTFPFVVAADTSLYAKWTCDYTYTTSGSTCTITSYKGPGGDVVIPAAIDGYAVTAIADRPGGQGPTPGVFANNSTITSVTLPGTLTTIGIQAFYNCTSLTSVSLLNGPTTIGREAFSHCIALTSITLPNSLTTVGDEGFYDCAALTSITLPDSLTTIGEGAFGSCAGFVSVTVPAGVTSFGRYAFSCCTGLTSVTISAGVTSIGNYAFSCCTALTSVTISAGVTSIGDCAFDGCASLAAITLPNTVTTIGNSAFEACPSLASVNIPNGVTTIGEHAFASCPSLASVNIPDSVTSIGSLAFFNTGLVSVTIPASVTSVMNNAFGHDSALRSACFLGPKPTLGTEVFSSANADFTLYYNVAQASSWADFTTYPKVPFCVLTLNDNHEGGGSTAVLCTLDDGHHLSYPTYIPSRSGYAFAGWQTDATGTRAWDFAVDTVSGDLTLYAGWSIPLSLASGWNLVAGAGGTTFLSTLFGWNGTTYVSTTSPAAWQGYWCKPGSAQTVSMSVTSGPHTTTLVTGWNLIGNPMDSTAALTLPSGRVAFAYDPIARTYVSTTSLAPGQGAWVKGTAGETVGFGGE